MRFACFVSFYMHSLLGNREVLKASSDAHDMISLELHT